MIFDFSALNLLFQFDTLILMLGGVILGILVGCLPGLGAAMGVALLFPFTLQLNPVPGIMMLLGIYVGAIYGGSVSAILLRIPGTAAAAATMLDGYELTKKGESGRALGISTVSSYLGGTIGALILIFFSPLIARFAIRFGPAEYFALGVFGLTIVAFVAGNNVIKGWIGAIIGMFLATIGMDPLTSVPRYTFNLVELITGLDYIAVIIGLFGFSQVFVLGSKELKETYIVEKIVSRVLPTISDLKQIATTILRGSLIGTFIGALPGTGASVSVWVAYNEAKRSSKNPERFGKGAIEGIAASESSNNAVTGGALIPLLTLGIPGDSVTAILLGAFMIHNLTPGPLLFSKHPDIITALFVGLLVANLFMLIAGLTGARIFAKIATVPPNILLPTVATLCIIGSYAVRNSLFDVLIMIIFGFVGFVFEVIGIDVVTVILGFILGPMIEHNLRRTLILSQGSLMGIVERPVSLILIVLTLVTLLTPFLKAKFNAISNRKAVRDSQ